MDDPTADTPPPGERAGARAGSRPDGRYGPRDLRGVDALGDFIRSQRRLAELSQRELARLADLSDAYLSQLERGLHEPSVRVVNALAGALNIPPDKLLRFLRITPGCPDDGEEAEEGPSTESVILTDDRLTEAQKQSLLDVYRAFLAANAQL